ncbi:hypothetical protein Tco_1063502 [Tanacetum coccineum]
MGDENPIRTLGDYSRPNQEGYRNTIELLDGNNVVPLRSDTIRLVQNGCSFHGLWSADPNQHFKDFLKLVDSLDLDVANRERTHQHLFQFSLCNQASNWLERESLSEAWTRFQDLLQKVPHHGIDLWLQVQIFYDHINLATRRTIDHSADDVLSTSDRRLIELENQVQRLMEAHFAPKPPVQVNKIASSCKICSGPHDSQYCMKNPEQDFVDYAYSRTDEAGGKWFIFKPEQNNLGDTYNPSWKSHPNLRWRQPQNSQNNFSNPPNHFQPHDARLSKFEADFKQQQSKMTNKIDIFLKAINDQMTGDLPSDTVKNPKLNVNHTSLVSSARSYPMEDPQSSSHPHNSINAIKTCSKQTNEFQKDQPQVKTQTVNEIRTPKRKEPKKTLENEFKKLHLNLSVLEVLAHAPIYNAILDKYVESLELGIVKNVEVHIGKLKLLEDFYAIDMEKDLATLLLVGRGFLATTSVVIDCKKAKIAVGEGVTRSIFRVKEINLGDEEVPYWTTLGKRESYEPRDDIGARPPYYARPPENGKLLEMPNSTPLRMS